MLFARRCIVHLKDSGTSSIKMVWLVQIKPDSTDWTDGASSVRLSSASGLFESAQILMCHLRENNSLTMLSLSVCLPAENRILSILLAVDRHRHRWSSRNICTYNTKQASPPSAKELDHGLKICSSQKQNLHLLSDIIKISSHLITEYKCFLVVFEAHKG